jgi:hypothetical protein
MWHCTQCEIDVEESFDVCWHCGTTRDGTPDPDFRTADDPDAIPRTRRDRPQFTIWSLLALMLWSSILFAALRDCVMSGLADHLERAVLGFLAALVAFVALLCGVGTWVAYALAAVLRRWR